MYVFEQLKSYDVSAAHLSLCFFFITQMAMSGDFDVIIEFRFKDFPILLTFFKHTKIKLLNWSKWHMRNRSYDSIIKQTNVPFFTFMNFLFVALFYNLHMNHNLQVSFSHLNDSIFNRIYFMLCSFFDDDYFVLQSNFGLKICKY